MKITLQRAVALLVVLGSALMVNCAQAQSTQSTFLYVAHAVPGRSVASAVTPGLPIASTNPAFPVDLMVNNICVAKGLAFGEIRGPLSGPAGTYNLSFTPANVAAPCTGTPVFAASVTFAAGTTYIGVLTLNASNNVTGQLYTADLTPISVGQGRIQVINASQDTLTASLTSSSGTVAGGVSPGKILESAQPAGLYTTTITGSTDEVLVGPVNVQLEQRNSYIYVLTGAVADNSVQLVGPATIRGVF